MTTLVLVIAGVAALVVALLVMGSHKPSPPQPPTPPDLGALAVAELARREQERKAARLREKLDEILASEFEAPRPNE